MTLNWLVVESILKIKNVNIMFEQMMYSSKGWTHLTQAKFKKNIFWKEPQA